MFSASDTPSCARGFSAFGGEPYADETVVYRGLSLPCASFGAELTPLPVDAFKPSSDSLEPSSGPSIDPDTTTVAPARMGESGGPCFVGGLVAAPAAVDGDGGGGGIVVVTVAAPVEGGAGSSGPPPPSVSSTASPISATKSGGLASSMV